MSSGALGSTSYGQGEINRAPFAHEVHYQDAWKYPKDVEQLLATTSPMSNVPHPQKWEPSVNGHGGISQYAEPYVPEQFRGQLGTEESPGPTSLGRMSTSQQTDFAYNYPYGQSQRVSNPPTGQQNLFPETTFANFDTWLRGEKERMTASGKEAGYNPYEGKMTQLPPTFTGIKPGQWVYQGGNVVRSTDRPGDQMLLPDAQAENKRGWSDLARQMQEFGPLDGKGHGGTSQAEEMDETASEGGVAIDGGKGSDTIRVYVTHDDQKSHNGETHGGPTDLVGSEGLAQVFGAYNDKPAHNPVKQFFPPPDPLAWHKQAIAQYGLDGYKQIISSDPAAKVDLIRKIDAHKDRESILADQNLNAAYRYARVNLHGNGDGDWSPLDKYRDLETQGANASLQGRDRRDLINAVELAGEDTLEQHPWLKKLYLDAKNSADYSHGDGIGSPQNIGSDGPGNAYGPMTSLG